MSPAEPLRIVNRGGDGADCGIVSISMYTGESYADVMREVLRHDRKGGKEGLTDRVIRKTMEGLGMPVRYTRWVDDTDHYGLMRLSDHLVVLMYGLVIEPGDSWCGIWPLDTYVANTRICPHGWDDVHGIFLAK